MKNLGIQLGRVLGMGLLVMLFSSLAFAAHNGNNKASFSAVNGDAVVNYSEGTGTFNGSIRVRGLEAGVTYTFSVVTPGPDTTICTGTANNGGVFTCSAQGLTLPGFSFAVLSGPSGEIDSAAFSRTGNCRDPNQGGSQCESNDRP